MSAVADVRPGACEVWAGTQNPNGAQEAVAKALGIPAAAVTINVTLLGGGFGRRGRSDFVLDAVEASRATRAPVKVLWTRQDDMRVGDFHPVSFHRMAAGLDASGRPVAWRHVVASPLPRGGGSPPTEEQLRALLRGAYDLPYAVPALQADFGEAASPVRTSSWRGVNHNHNVFAAECFFDEVALAAGKDPLALRLALLKADAVVPGGREGKPVDRARLAAVLDLAGRKAGWGAALPAGRARGVACAAYDGQTSAAAVVEVTVGRDGTWRADRVVCAVDPGVAVNPLGIRAQVEGAAAWALSALSTEITLKAGRVEQATYRDFPILRFRDMPRVETAIVESDAAPTGMGEPPCRSSSRRRPTRCPPRRAGASAGCRCARRTSAPTPAGRGRDVAKIAFILNGKRRDVDAPAEMPLLWVLRDTLGMTGTKFGCGAGVCGSCTVHVDGEAAQACQVPVGMLGGRRVTTIEGLDNAR
jgi:isoquinoline 1-oxidoreductase beta subunit